MSDVVYEKVDDDHVRKTEKTVLDKEHLLINKVNWEQERDNAIAEIAKIDQLLEILNIKELER